MTEDWMRDISGLAGLPACLTVTAFSFIQGERVLGTELAAAIAASYVVTWPVRMMWFRARPIVQEYRTLRERIDACSFPSLHAMRGGAIWTVIALWFRNPLLSLICLAIIVLTSWSRLWLRRHHASDVLAGALIGLAIGWAVHGRVL